MPNYSNWISLNSSPAPLFLKLLFIHKSKSESFSGLKGQYHLPQGIVSGGTIRNAALGMGCKRKTVRKHSMNKANNPFRTELQDIIFREHKVISFVRIKIFALKSIIARTILVPVLQPRATLLRRLPWARLYCPFRTFLFSLLIIISLSI